MTSSSSSRARLRLEALLGPLFAADMLGRRGELVLVSMSAKCLWEGSQPAPYLIVVALDGGNE